MGQLGKLVCVQWDDILSLDGAWHDPAIVTKAEPMTCYTFGLLVRDDDLVVLAGSVTAHGMLGDVTIIPASNVRAVQTMARKLPEGLTCTVLGPDRAESNPDRAARSPNHGGTRHIRE